MRNTTFLTTDTWNEQQTRSLMFLEPSYIVQKTIAFIFPSEWNPLKFSRQQLKIVFHFKLQEYAVTWKIFLNTDSATAVEMCLMISAWEPMKQSFMQLFANNINEKAQIKHLQWKTQDCFSLSAGKRIQRRTRCVWYTSCLLSSLSELWRISFKALFPPVWYMKQDSPSIPQIYHLKIS